jgi:pilus assembly protein CpaE
MLNAIVLTGDSQLSGAIQNLAAESGQVTIHKVFSAVSRPYELIRALNTTEADLLFLDLSDYQSSVTLAVSLPEQCPLTAIIGVGVSSHNGAEPDFTQVTGFEQLSTPASLEDFRDTVDRAVHRVRGTIQENLLAFLPAKAGSGCTTVAINTAGVLADDLHRKVLVIESDLHSGVISLLLNAQSEYSILTALGNSERLDATSWTQYVAQAAGLDLLLTKRAKRKSLPLWSNYLQLLEFAKPRYDTIVVDLPEVVNDATVEIVRRAKQVFVVCTPELPSLTLAQQRLSELQTRQISEERVGILVNRWHKNDLPPVEIESFLKHKVVSVFRNDYRSVNAAMMESRLLERSTELRASIQRFAEMLAGIEVETAEEVSRRGFTGGFLKMLTGQSKKSVHSQPASKS